jgi:two-component system cell cycle sensor histidine kinase/response regulator CckA
MPMAGFQRGNFKMGDRVTRATQSRELVRAKRLRQALERGAPPTFVPPAVPNPVAPPLSLSWSSIEKSSVEKNPVEHPGKTNSAEKNSKNAKKISSEETLNTRRQYLEQLFQNSPDPLVIVDTSFRGQCVNQEFQRLFGYSAAQVLGKPVNQLIFPLDRAAEAEWIMQCLERGEQITLETQRLAKDGTLLDVSVSSAPLIIDGQTVAFYAIYRDISERKRAEALSSALYRIAEKASATQDLQQFFAAIHGIVDELMCARNFSIALHDPESQLVSFPYFVDEQESAPAPTKLGSGLVEFVLRTGEPLLCTPQVAHEMQQRGKIKLNHPPPLHWLSVPLKVNHHILGAVILKSYSKNTHFRERDQDVLALISQQLAAAIDRKRNEQSLRRSELCYRSLVQTAVYGIYRSSLDGRFLDVNPALIGMLGYDSAHDVLSLDPKKDVFVDPAEYTRLVDEFRRSGRMDGFEVRWKRKDAAIITVRISGRAVASDEPTDVLEAIAEDITERRVLEDQFRQAQKMEAVGRLAGGIAHDFNNLLMVISGYTEVMLGQITLGHPLHSKAEAIQQASDRATTLTRQLLAFSRKQLLELKVIDVNAIVADMERLLRPLIGEDIELTTSLAPSVGCTRADAGQLEQVIMNLVVNAKDALPNGGKISIRTASVNLDDSYRPENTFIKNGPYVMISVSDNGEGMDRETQARIFEPFFTTKEKGKGTGLGLSTVYGIIKQSGGYVFVQSEPARGTVFTIYFPRVDEPSDAIGATPVALAAVGGTETVLLVEDEDSVRQLVRETLESRGYRVLEAGNGADALTLAAAHSDPIHLVITDVVMPGLNGHELVQQLQSARPGLKVLYLSGYAQDAFPSTAAADSQKTFLQKPFTLQSLSRKVREILGPPAN